MDTIYFPPPRRGLPGLLLLITTHGPVYRWLPVAAGGAGAGQGGAGGTR